MRYDKIKAARRLSDSLQDDSDFLMYLMDHPNAKKALERISTAVKSLQRSNSLNTAEGICQWRR